MRYLSVCSGIEAATVAWHPLGWRPWAFAEVDKFPSAVLAHHYPDVPNLGDMTRFKEWPDADIDVLVGGTPCQSFSVAGLRKGLADPRGNLVLTFLAIAERYRPEWLVWENVPGVLSSGGGRDFGSFLGALVELGYGFAYRVLDAQYFGLAQRRQRVFVVGCARGWQRAAAVLFERASLSGHPAPRRKAGEEVAGTVTRSLGRCSAPEGERGGLIDCSPSGIAGAMSSKWAKGTGGPAGDEHYNLVAHSLRASGFDASEGGTGRGTPLVPVGVTIHGTDGTTKVASYDDVAQCLRARTPGNIDNSSTTVVQQPVAFSCEDRGADAGEVAPTLRSMGHDGSHANAGGQVAVAFHENQRAEVTLNDTAGSLKVGGGKPGQGYPSVMAGMQVRRLTPRECERLQGFPDDYTLITYRGKPAADGPRYKALGDSMAVPCMAWIGRRIAAVDAIGRQERAA